MVPETESNILDREMQRKMMKLIVYVHGIDSFVNIFADRIEKDDVFLYAYSGDKLVGLFDVGTIMTAYLSEKK